MNGAPRLHLRDVEEELRAIHAQARRSLITAIYGRIEAPAQITVAVGAACEPRAFEVREVDSELALRQALAEARGANLALLVDFESVPLDVAARLARGKVLHISRSRRLASLLGARPTAELLASGLAQAVLRDGRPYDARPAGLAVDLDTTWRLFLQRHLDQALEGASEEAWVVFCARVASADRLTREFERQPGLRAELIAWLEQTFGKVAPLALGAMERGQAELVPQLAYVLEAASAPARDDGFLHGLLGQLVSRVDEQLWSRGGLASPVLAAWARLPEALNRRARPDELARWAAGAERLFLPEQARAALGTSRWLPIGFTQRLERLATALTSVARDPSREGASAAAACYRELDAHQAAITGEQPPATKQRALAAARLAHWLASRDPARTEELAPARELVRLAEDYVREGGFVDWALAQARGSSADALGKAIEAVVERVEQARDALDLRFARALGDWARARRSSGQLVAIEAALERFGAAFLEESSARKLLVLVLDGMGWASAVELLESLREGGYAPIRWRPKDAPPGAGALLPPVLAALPTITEVSRSALFAGRLPENGQVHQTSKDPDRFAEHAALGKVRGVRAPRLMLKGEVQKGSGAASDAALALVDSEDPVVGLVLNAIDDQLKSGTQVRVSWSLESIRPLEAVLEHATRAGRAVLLMADHGHVPGARAALTGLKVDSGGARWRALGREEQADSRELVLEGKAVWSPRGRPRVGLLIAERDSHIAAAHAGEHGGASLAEVVAPAVLIAGEQLAQQVRLSSGEDTGTNALELAPFPRPGWWDLELPRQALASEAAAPAEVAPPQLVMPFTVPPPQVAPPTARSTSPGPWTRKLTGSKLLLERGGAKKAELANSIAPWVEVLATHDGRMTEELFSYRVGLMKWRVRGAVASLAEWLNIDGQPVAWFDEAEKTVRLDLEALRQLLEDEA